jgi:hypothetical protein
MRGEGGGRKKGAGKRRKKVRRSKKTRRRRRKGKIGGKRKDSVRGEERGKKEGRGREGGKRREEGGKVGRGREEGGKGGGRRDEGGNNPTYSGYCCRLCPLGGPGLYPPHLDRHRRTHLGKLHQKRKLRIRFRPPIGLRTPRLLSRNLRWAGIPKNFRRFYRIFRSPRLVCALRLGPLLCGLVGAALWRVEGSFGETDF